MTNRLSRIPFVGLVACLAFGKMAHAADDSEIWPEVSAFVPLNARSRLFF